LFALLIEAKRQTELASLHGLQGGAIALRD